jgi:hypothetical protein
MIHITDVKKHIHICPKTRSSGTWREMVQSLLVFEMKSCESESER